MSYFFIASRHGLSKILATLWLFTGSFSAAAAIHGGVDFTGVPISFADVMVSYDPLPDSGGKLPNAGSNNRYAALGVPDYITTGPYYVSLGVGGSLTLGFSDKYFTGSGTSANDLWIFEIGTPEAVTVEISKDQNAWFSLGNVKGVGIGAAVGIDLDQFGFGINDLFSFVRLTDVIADGETLCATSTNYCFVGADIDAVGITSSAPVPVPTAIWLFVSGLIGLGAFARRRPYSAC